MAILIQALLFSLSGIAMANPIMRSEARSSDVGMHVVDPSGDTVDKTPEKKPESDKTPKKKPESAEALTKVAEAKVKADAKAVAKDDAAKKADADAKKADADAKKADADAKAAKDNAKKVDAEATKAAKEVKEKADAEQVPSKTCGGDFVQCDSPYLKELIQKGLATKEYVHSAEECAAIAKKDLASEGTNFKLLSEVDLLMQAKNWDPKIRADNIAIFNVLRGVSVDGIPTRCFRMPCDRAGELLKILKDEKDKASILSAANKKCYFFNEVESEKKEDKQTDHTGHSMCAIPRYIFSEEFKLGSHAKCPDGYESLEQDDEQGCQLATTICGGEAVNRHCTRNRAFIEGLGKGCFMATNGLQTDPTADDFKACIFTSSSNNELTLQKLFAKKGKAADPAEMKFKQLCRKTHSK